MPLVRRYSAIDRAPFRQCVSVDLKLFISRTSYRVPAFSVVSQSVVDNSNQRAQVLQTDLVRITHSTCGIVPASRRAIV